MAESLRIRNDGHAERVGIEHGEMTLLTARGSAAGLVLAFRTEGRKYWAGRGQQGYGGTEVETFLMVEARAVPEEGTLWLKVEHLISVPLRTRAQQDDAPVTTSWLRKRLQRDAMEAANIRDEG